MSDHARYKTYLRSLLFTPSSFSGISSNYLYFILYFINPIKTKNLWYIHLFVVYAVISYLIGAIAFSHGDPHFLIRQTLSFISFLSLSLLLYLKIDLSLKDINDSVIIVSVIYSLWVIFIIFTHPEFHLSDPYYIKSGLRKYVPDWPQRFVILIIYASLVTVERLRISWKELLKLIPMITCIYLTFTRSAYLSFLVSLLIYFLLNLPKKDIKYFIKLLTIFAIAAISLIFLLQSPIIGKNFMLIVTKTYMPIAHFITGENVIDHSAASRIEYWQSAMSILSTSPITGTGFGGIYLFRSDIGSTHN